MDELVESVREQMIFWHLRVFNGLKLHYVFRGLLECFKCCVKQIFKHDLTTNQLWAKVICTVADCHREKSYQRNVLTIIILKFSRMD